MVICLTSDYGEAPLNTIDQILEEKRLRISRLETIEKTVVELKGTVYEGVDFGEEELLKFVRVGIFCYTIDLLRYEKQFQKYE